ncbi:hypothetical protein [Streptomyces sp. NBC_00344]|uniref:hypothetical protein n=1 Tax=Streptomyces sp. NBC_00344 TaxID=2975720 RepID=UPI002E227684
MSQWRQQMAVDRGPGPDEQELGQERGRVTDRGDEVRVRQPAQPGAGPAQRPAAEGKGVPADPYGEHQRQDHDPHQDPDRRGQAALGPLLPRSLEFHHVPPDDAARPRGSVAGLE